MSATDSGRSGQRLVFRRLDEIRKITPFGIVFAIALVAAFSPSKALGAMSGLLAILAILWVFPVNRLLNARRLAVALTIYAAFGLLYRLMDDTTHLTGLVLFLVTHFHFLLVAVRPDRPPGLRDLRQIARLSFWMLIVQAPLGIVQATAARSQSGTFDSANGDAVNGTIDVLVAFGDSPPRGSNVMFGILVVTLCCILFGLSRTWIERLVAVLGLVAFVFASIVHLNLFLFLASVTVFAVAILGSLLPRLKSSANPEWRRMIPVPAFLAATFVAAAFVTPNNYGTFRNYVLPEIENLSAPAPTAPTSAPTPTRVDQFDNHKVKIAFITLYELPSSHPRQPWIGVGPGQFNSRAGLIASGTYLSGTPVPEAVRGISNAFEQHFLPLWLKELPTWAGSSWFPFFSVQSLYAETGGLGIIGVSALVFFVARRLSCLLCHDILSPTVTSASAVLLLFLVGIGLYENYWEWSQGVVTGSIFFWVLVHSPLSPT